MAFFQSVAAQSRASRKVVIGHLNLVHGHAHAAHLHEERRKSGQKTLEDLRTQNPEFATLDQSKNAAYLVMLANLVAAYIIDCVLFGAAIDYFASLSFEDWPIALVVFRFVVPLAVIFIETNVAYHFAAAREEAAEYGKRPGQYWFWLGSGIVLALAMPAVGLGTHIVSNHDSANGDLTWGLDVLTIGLAILAFCTHAGILFGGTQAHDSKAFVCFQFSNRRLRSDIQQVQRAYDRECRATRAAFAEYMRRLQSHNTTYLQDLIDAGPFDVIAREIVNKIFGYEIIQAPAAANRTGDQTGNDDNGSQPPPNGAAAPDPESASQSSGESAADGENEYLRTILNRKMRDDDSEVRP